MTKSNSLFKKALALLLSIVFAISSFAVTGISAITAKADEQEYYFMAYFTGNAHVDSNGARTQATRFAVSADGVTFSALNNNDPVITQQGGTRNSRDHFAFQGQDGKYYIIGTDQDYSDNNWGKECSNFVLWRSDDLITWEEKIIDLHDVDGLSGKYLNYAWAPEVIWDSDLNQYIIYFAFMTDYTKYQTQMMYYIAATDLWDVSTWETPAMLFDCETACIDGNITYYPDEGENGMYYMFYKNEAGGGICLAKSEYAHGPYTYYGYLHSSDATGALEGCQVFKRGDEYIFFADRYGSDGGQGGNFAIYNLGEDLSAIPAGTIEVDGTNGSPVETINGIDGFSNLIPRHGSVIKISKAQYDALIDAYGGSSPDDITFAFDKDYSHENGWDYAGGVNDASGYKYDLLCNTGKYTYVYRQNHNLSVNGGNMFVNDSTIKNMFASGNSWTVSFNANVVSKRGAPLFALTSGVSSSNNTDWIRFLDNGDFYINNGSEYVKKGSTDITTTTDYEFVITYDGTYITLYKDGVKQFTSNVGTINYDKAASTSYVAFGWTDTIGTNGVQASYTNVRFRSQAISASKVAAEYDDNLIYQYNEGTHEAINGRANVTYNSPKTTTTYVGKRGASFAVAGWVNIGAYKHDGAVLFEFGEGGTGNGKNYLTLLEDGTIKWCWSEGSTPRYVDIDSIYDFATDTYYFVQINIIPDGSQYHFQAFVNGESVKDVTSGYTSMQTQAYGPINFLSSNRALNFGQGNAYWTTAGYNIIDDIRVYNRAVDAAALYSEICVEDIAADARAYVIANLDDYDVEAETNAINTGSTKRKAYHYESECVGGYSNVLAQTAPSSTDQVSTAFAGNTTVGSNTYNLFWPSNIALLYDGVHKTAMPVVLELKGSKYMSTLSINQDSGKSPDWKFDHYWTGSTDAPWHDNIWKEWPGLTYAYTTSFTGDYPTTDNGGSTSVTDSNAHIGYNWGAEYDWGFTPSSGTRFFWNQTNYIGTGNTSTYYESYSTIYARAWQDSERTIPNCTHNTYVINYKPVYDILKSSNPTAVPNTIGNIGLKAVYDNLVKNHESDWTTDSLNQFYVAAYKVLTCNPVDYSEQAYRDNFSGTVSAAAKEIKDAVNEFNKINLVASANFSGLTSAVSTAQDILDNYADDYTAASIEALENAVDAVTYLDFTEAERSNMSSADYQDEIDAEASAVTTAKNALVAKIVITFDMYNGPDVVVKVDPGTTAADVEAAAPAHYGEPYYESSDNNHYEFYWEETFTDATANKTYTENTRTVAHQYSGYTHLDGTSTHSASCSVNGQNHTDTLPCDFTVTYHEATSTTNSYNTYTCKYCNYSYDGDYGAQDWTAYDTAVAAYDAKAAEEDFTAKYTEASRTAFASAASSKLTKADTVSQSAINTATTALENAVSGLAIQEYTITFDMVGTDRDKAVSLAYGSTAEDVAAEAPELKAANHNETYHYTYAWNSDFAAVTGAATYSEVETETAHSYNDVHTAASGDANGYTTYTCACGHSYVEYDSTNSSAYTDAVAEYNAIIGAEDYEAHYTEASRTAYEDAVAAVMNTVDTSDNTKSAAYFQSKAAEITAANDELVVQTYTIRFRPDGLYSSSTEVYLPYGTTAEEVATYAPANTTPKFANQYQHRVYYWPEFATVTANAYYNEQDTKESHTITDEYHAADGETNGYTTHTCYICGGTQHETYDPQDWSAYDIAVAAYDAAAADIAANEGKYTAASVSAFNSVSKLTKANTVSQSAIDTATDNLNAAVSGLAIQSYTITFDMVGSDRDKAVSLAYGSTAEDVAAEAPELKAANHNDTYHYTYAWNTDFAAVTGAATYTEVETETAHSYNGVYTEPSGNANGYTTYTCACGHSYVDYDPLNWTAYDAAVAAYDAADDEENFTAKYTEASRTAYTTAASNKLTKADTVSQDAIDNATTALNNAVSGLTVQEYTITFDMVGTDRDSSASLAYGSTAEAVAAEAPELKAANHNETYHYTYAWDADFAAVTGAATYTEVETETAHSYNDVHTAASGDENGYTTHTCECGYSYVTYDAQDWSAYDTAVAAYDAAAADIEANEGKYTAASVSAFNSVSKLTKADTVSQSAIDNATTALNNAVSGLVIDTADFTALDEAIAAGNAKIAELEAGSTLYTEASVNALIAAINDAVEARETAYKSSQQDTVDAFSDDVYDAIDGLSTQPTFAPSVDETTVATYEAAIDKVVNIDTDIYDLGGVSVEEFVAQCLTAAADANANNSDITTIADELTQEQVEAIITECLEQLSANIKKYHVIIEGNAEAEADSRFSGEFNAVSGKEYQYEGTANTRIIFTSTSKDTAWYMSYESTNAERSKQYQTKGRTFEVSLIGDIHVYAEQADTEKPNKVEIIRNYSDREEATAVQSVEFTGDSFTLPNAPALPFYTFTGYTLNDAAVEGTISVDSDIVIYANYERTENNAYTVKITGVNSAEDYNLFNDSASYNTKVEVYDSSAYAWIDGDNDVFFVGKRLTFFVAESVELQAITEEEFNAGGYKTPAVKLRKEGEIQTEGKLTFNAQVVQKDTDEIVEYGILIGKAKSGGSISASDLILKNTTNDNYTIVRAKSTKLFGAYQFTIGLNIGTSAASKGDYLYRAYAIYRTENGLETIYTDVKTATVS